MKKISLALVCLSLVYVSFTQVAEARNRQQDPRGQDPVTRPVLPDCLDQDKRAISGDNNDEVLRWKEESKNQTTIELLLLVSWSEFYSTENLTFS